MKPTPISHHTSQWSSYSLLKTLVSHEKNLPTFHYTGWLIGILIMAYYNPYITGQYFIPYITQPTRGPFFGAHLWNTQHKYQALYLPLLLFVPSVLSVGHLPEDWRTGEPNFGSAKPAMCCDQMMMKKFTKMKWFGVFFLVTEIRPYIFGTEIRPSFLKKLSKKKTIFRGFKNLDSGFSPPLVLNSKPKKWKTWRIWDEMSIHS